ncbi:MAG: response regulator transcription factor [Gammaproteobacteria bacterium]|nr:response regulator transcription factor [Gammaproteobacteria bacterium]MBU1553622.1 response regulator transcription factor [Gammaproteobacteria bacterium]MBU2069269.1 response regulator transcription factor [Gammaproteobacteria bacterium]MBU2183264.1 response regulator transcription factor [Gammaproteobacteria bacterium]MBU2204479.1 response regulator transcription factor [Gammaproteobacteria bacterium]
MTILSVLVIEDTPEIGREVCDFLATQGMQVDYAATGGLGLSLAQQQHYDVIVLDVMLPDINGVAVCKTLKQSCDPLPAVLMLTARDSITDKSLGFDAGADDYLTKPFDLTELLLRCQALARRHQLHQSKTIVIGELAVNEKQQLAERQGQHLKLSSTDFAILLLLVQAYPNAVSRQQLVNKIWGDDTPDSDVVRSHIYTLRQALDKPFATPMLATLHGIGFKLQVQG